ncbi:hypothetical protein SUGI_0880990 [Cryptomeria japonica]|nr:hypothetical protein SUGI_0880990 [Cryptomeria japonica]
MKLLIRDYDVSIMANDLTKVFHSDMFESEGVKKVQGTNDDSGGSDDKVVVGEDEELIDIATPSDFSLATAFDTNTYNNLPRATNYFEDLSSRLEKVGISDNSSFI